MICPMGKEAKRERELDAAEYLLCVQNRMSCNQADSCTAIHPSKQVLFKLPTERA